MLHVLLDAICDVASSAALPLSLQSSSALSDILKLVQICCNVATKLSICFCLFLSICSTMSTLFVLLSILFCSCDVSLLPLMFSNIFLKLKYSIKTVRKAIKNINFCNATLPSYLRPASTETYQRTKIPSRAKLAIVR